MKQLEGHIRIAWNACAIAFALALVLPMVPDIRALMFVDIVELREHEDRAANNMAEDNEVHKLIIEVVDHRQRIQRSSLLLKLDRIGLPVPPFLEQDAPPPEVV